MDYDVERSRHESEEIRKVFREMFPLTNENDLPWAPSHIKGFLRDRIEREASERVFHWQAGIVRVLAEVSPPKMHAVDMARIVVDQAKEVRRMKDALNELADLREDRRILWNAIRAIGKVTGCNHTEDRDGWAKLPQCVEETLKPKQ